MHQTNCPENCKQNVFPGSTVTKNGAGVTLSSVYHFLVYFRIACTLILFAHVLYCHIFLCCLLLQIRHVRIRFLKLREHFRDFVACSPLVWRLCQRLPSFVFLALRRAFHDTFPLRVLEHVCVCGCYYHQRLHIVFHILLCHGRLFASRFPSKGSSIGPPHEISWKRETLEIEIWRFK